MIRKKQFIKPQFDTTSHDSNSGIEKYERGSSAEIFETDNVSVDTSYSLNGETSTNESSSITETGFAEKSEKEQDGMSVKKPSDLYDQLLLLVNRWTQFFNKNQHEFKNSYWKKDIYQRRLVQIERISEELNAQAKVRELAVECYTDRGLMYICNDILFRESFTWFFRDLIAELKAIKTRIEKRTIQYVDVPTKNLGDFISELENKSKERMIDNSIEDNHGSENSGEINKLKEENRNISWFFHQLQNKHNDLKWQNGNPDLGILEDDNANIAKGYLYLRIHKGKFVYSIVTPNEKIVRDVLFNNIQPPKPFDLENLMLMKKEILSAVDPQHIPQILTKHDFEIKLKEREEEIEKNLLVSFQKRYTLLESKLNSRISENGLEVLPNDIVVQELKNTIKQQENKLEIKDIQIKTLQEQVQETNFKMENLEERLNRLTNIRPNNELKSSNVQIGENWIHVMPGDNGSQNSTSYSPLIRLKNSSSEVSISQFSLENSSSSQQDSHEHEYLKKHNPQSLSPNNIKKIADEAYEKAERWLEKKMLNKKDIKIAQILLKFSIAKTKYKEFLVRNKDELVQKRLAQLEEGGMYSIENIKSTYG